MKESGVSVKFVWVLRHCGVRGNEQADKHAKLALSLPEPTEKRDVSFLFPVLRSFSVGLSREHLLREAQHKGSRYFRFVQTFKQTLVYTRQKGDSVPPSVDNSYLKDSFILLWIITCSKDIVGSAACLYGHPNQDINHGFFHCSNNSAASNWLLIDLFHKGGLPWCRGGGLFKMFLRHVCPT